jgi:hypothetical protein
MQIDNHVRTLTLSAVLVFSVMSPLAARVSAAPSGSGSGSGSDSGPMQCETWNGTRDAKTGENYPPANMVDSGTTVIYDGPDGTTKWTCNDGGWDPALVIQTSHHPPIPASIPASVGAASAP